MSKPTEISVVIIKHQTSEKVWGVFSTFFLMFGPIIIGSYFNTGWAMNLMSFLLGIMLFTGYMLGVMKKMDGTRKNFTNLQEAAEWVRSWEPKEKSK